MNRKFSATSLIAGISILPVASSSAGSAPMTYVKGITRVENHIKLVADK